ncbi:unnamed protein product [Urochloa humidicola]
MDPIDLEFPPGDTSRRPRVVAAGAPRTHAIREAERDLEMHTLVAVQRDANVPLSCAAVLWDALRQLRIPDRDLSVEGLSKAIFLLRFSSVQARNAALHVREIYVANTALNIMRWSRRIGASLGRLRYRARICLEGVPRHARNATSVAQLFSHPSFIDEVDCRAEKEKERFCFILWVWTDAPTDLALKGKLQIEEPLEIPDDYPLSMEEDEPPLGRDGPAKTLDYEILIHLDCVLDYSPPSMRQGYLSDDSDISGIPREQGRS